MPELPDLVYIQNNLSHCLSGGKIKKVSIKQPIIFRTLIEQTCESALRDLCFGEVTRHGPFLCFAFDNELEMIVHPMLAGKFKVSTDGKTGRGLCFTLHLENGRAFHYLDNKKMGKVYLLKSTDRNKIPRFQEQGLDITSKQFSIEVFRSLIQKQRNQVRVFLMDQTKLSAIGNAYADEILYDCLLHPKTFCNQLEPEQIDRLYDSIVKVIAWGIAAVKKAGQPIDIKIRDHVKVRNRKDQPCPRCGDTIRRAGVLGYDSFFCPTCQPPKRSQFIEWGL